MEIQPIFKFDAENTVLSFNIKTRIYTVDSTDYDLNSLPTLTAVPKNDGTNQGEIDSIIAANEAIRNDNQVYQDADGKQYCKITVNQEMYSDLANNNWFLFHGYDPFGDLNYEKLDDFVTKYNMSSEESIEMKKAIMEKFTPEEWAAKRKALRQFVRGM